MGSSAAMFAQMAILMAGAALIVAFWSPYWYRFFNKNGTTLYPTTLSDGFAIGKKSAAAKLDVVGDGKFTTSVTAGTDGTFGGNVVVTGTGEFGGAVTVDGLLEANAGIDVTAGGIDVLAGATNVQTLNAAGLITGAAGLTISAGATNVQTLNAAGLITGAAGLTVSAGATNVQALNAAGLITGAAGLTVSAGNTSVQALEVLGAASLVSFTTSGTGSVTGAFTGGGVTLSGGGVDMAWTSATQDALGNPVTNNSPCGRVVTATLNTAVDGTQDVEILNSLCTSNSNIQVSVAYGGTGTMVFWKTLIQSGSFTIRLKNVDGTLPFNTTAYIEFAFLSY